jgi:hypothetical protein
VLQTVSGQGLRTTLRDFRLINFNDMGKPEGKAWVSKLGMVYCYVRHKCFSMCAFTEVTCMNFYNVKYKTIVYFCMNMNIKISSFSAVNIVSEVT